MDQDLSRLRALFDEVIQSVPESRAELLAARCGADPVLRKRVEALIATAEGDEPFLSEPTHAKPSFAGAATLATAPVSEHPGTRIGPYKLLQQIGEGGFGSVFMAEQQKPVVRKVALKIIKLGMDTRQVIARFEAERQALALMDHPNIARVLDAGATETGRPFFVMELVQGDPITAFADAHKLNLRERLAVFMQVCHAVQHAHTKGIIHRDLKPSNVLVNVTDGNPFAKVIDFGIAKATGVRLTDKTLFTEFRQLIGTPEYMSPEQAEGSPDIDTRTDVYALGVLLYELLTGATPFDAKRLRSAAFAEMQRIIKEEEPPAPSLRLSRNLETLAGTAAARRAEPGKLGTLMRGELDWIVMKSLEKERARRYESPNQLAADVQRHLAGEAVVAAPPSAVYRMRKFVRRHRRPVLAWSAVAAALVLGIVGTTWGLVMARDSQLKTEAVNGQLRGALNDAENQRRISERRLCRLQIERCDRKIANPEYEAAPNFYGTAKGIYLYRLQSFEDALAALTTAQSQKLYAVGTTLPHTNSDYPAYPSDVVNTEFDALMYSALCQAWLGRSAEAQRSLAQLRQFYADSVQKGASSGETRFLNQIAEASELIGVGGQLHLLYEGRFRVGPDQVNDWVAEVSDRLPLTPMLKREVADRLHAGILIIDPEDRAERALASYRIAWSTLLYPKSSPELNAKALLAADDANAITPRQMAIVTVRGFALYRLGRYQEAMNELLRAQGDANVDHFQVYSYAIIFTSLERTAMAVNLAVLAMAQWRLDKREEARTTLVRLREVMEVPTWADGDANALAASSETRRSFGGATGSARDDAKALAAEAEALIEPTGEPLR